MNSTVDQQSKCRRRNLLSTTQLFQDLVMFQMLSQVLRSFHHVSRLNKCGKWQCYLSQTFEEEPLKFNMDASNRQTSKVFFHCLNESYRLRVQKHLRIRASQDLATAAPKGARGRAWNARNTQNLCVFRISFKTWLNAVRVSYHTYHRLYHVHSFSVSQWYEWPHVPWSINFALEVGALATYIFAQQETAPVQREYQV